MQPFIDPIRDKSLTGQALAIYFLPRPKGGAFFLTGQANSGNHMGLPLRGNDFSIDKGKG